MISRETWKHHGRGQLEEHNDDGDDDDDDDDDGDCENDDFPVMFMMSILGNVDICSI